MFALSMFRQGFVFVAILCYSAVGAFGILWFGCGVVFLDPQLLVGGIDLMIVGALLCEAFKAFCRSRTEWFDGYTDVMWQYKPLPGPLWFWLRAVVRGHRFPGTR